MATKRKRRSDRAYLIYVITCSQDGARYIGVVVRKGAAVQKTLRWRFMEHCDRAMNLGKEWTLHIHMRKHGVECFNISLLETVRGKAAAHIREVELIDQGWALLNTKRKRY